LGGSITARQDALKYRKFGVLEWEASVLGLGTSSLLVTEQAPASFDSTASIEQIRYAIDRGVNYLDLGYPYDLKRQERIACMIGDALQAGYLEKVKTCVTLPSHLIHTAEDFEFYLNEQLGWLGTDKADFCLLGRLNRETWPALQQLGAPAWADEALRCRRIESIGFSFHDHFQIFKSILAAYDRWDFCQFQFSYMDVDHDPGISGIKFAAERGLAVVVDEPLRSGRLTKMPPPSVSGIWKEAGGLARLAEFGLRSIWSYPEVSTVVLDLSSFREIEEAVTLAGGAAPDSLTIQEEILISRVRDEYLKLRRIPCSSCRPCMPCPEGIDVPRIFEIYNDAFLFEDLETARAIYRNELHSAGDCTRCRLCEERCVKKLAIIDLLDRVRRLLD
jgi:predicted aldo/keto reductase-like oxidoreductase